MIELVFVMETKSSSKTDWMYIKSTIDYYYKPRTYSLKKIFAKSKSELIQQERKIKDAIKSTERIAQVIICADYDREEQLNNKIINYCRDNKYDLVWMNLDIEDVYLQRQVKERNKVKEAINFQKRKDTLILALNLNNNFPLRERHSSNILLVLDKYITRS